MPDYEKLYFKMFNGVTDIIEDLKNLQQEAEELYIESCEQENESIIKSNNSISFKRKI